jgi:hypothetical protein
VAAAAGDKFLLSFPSGVVGPAAHETLPFCGRVASAAATLLNLIHPYDAAATDLAVRALAIMIVILVNTIFGRRILMSSSR